MPDGLQDLARRALACPSWRLLSGMADTRGRRVEWARDGEVKWWGVDAVERGFWNQPDFTDPLTVLGVLVLVREAFSNQTLTPMRSLSGYWFWSRGTASGEFKSELDALIAGLEAAPVPS